VGLKVPLPGLQAQYASIRDGVLAAGTRAGDTRQFSVGPGIERLEPRRPVIEDAALAIGAAFKGRTVGAEAVA
jgi:hypothetical protein